MRRSAWSNGSGGYGMENKGCHVVITATQPHITAVINASVLNSQSAVPASLALNTLLPYSTYNGDVTATCYDCPAAHSHARNHRRTLADKERSKATHLDISDRAEQKNIIYVSQSRI